MRPLILLAMTGLLGCTGGKFGTDLEITSVSTDGTEVVVSYALSGDGSHKVVTRWRAGSESGLATGISGDAGTVEPGHNLEVVWNAAEDVPGDLLGEVELVLDVDEELEAGTGLLNLAPSVNLAAVSSTEGVRRLSVHSEGDRVAIAWSTEADPPGLQLSAGTPEGGMAWTRSIGGTDDPRWNPAVAFVDDGAVVVWQDYRNEDAADIYGARVDRNGTTALEERLDAASSTYNSMVPVLSNGPAGLVAAWTDNRDDDTLLRYQAWSSVYVAISVDGGRNWDGTDVRVDTGAYLEGVSYDPVVAQDASGRIYVAWLDSRTGDYEVRLNRSDDGGSTWLSADVLVSTGMAQELRMISPADGQLVLCWEDWSGDTPNVVFSTSLDAGNSFTPPTQVNSDIGPARDPAMAIFEGEVAIAWADQSAGAPDVHVARSLDGGLSFDDTLLGDDAPGAAASVGPTLAYDQSGRLAVAWVDAAGGDYVPMVAMLINEGWTAATPLHDGDAASDLQIVAAGDAGWFAVWREAAADYGLVSAGYQARLGL